MTQQTTSSPQGFAIDFPNIPTTNNSYFPGLGNVFDTLNYTSNYNSYGGSLFLVQTQVAVNTGVTIIVGYIEIDYNITYYNHWA